MVWSPDKISLAVGVLGRKPCLSNGCKKADYDLIVGKDGEIYRVGSKGVEVRDVVVVKNGKIVLESTAIKTWDDILEAIKILQTGTSKVGYVYESLISNQLITVLCTSLEVYCKKRFLELIGEGIEPNYSNLELVFFSKGERDKRLLSTFAEEAKAKGHSLAHELVEKRKIDFGNYRDCKDAYSEGYGKFPEDLEVNSKVIQSIVEFISYRHRIIHVSPFLGMLNILDVPPKEPVFSNKALVDLGVKNFDAFIKGLHKATLKLVPK